MNLLWVDLETGGEDALDPYKSRILEIAAYTTPLERPFDPPMNLVHRVIGCSQLEVNRFDSYSRETHAANGLIAECLNRGHGQSWPYALEEATDAICKLVSYEEKSEDRTVLAGSSVHFDLGFLRVHMPDLAMRLSHRVYDVSAVKLFCRSLGMPKPPTGEVAHRAVLDLLYSVQAARDCAEWLCDHFRHGHVRDEDHAGWAL